MANENFNFQLSFVEPTAEPIMTVGGGGFSDLHPFVGGTYGDIVDARPCPTPDSFDQPGVGAIELDLVCAEAPNAGLRSRKLVQIEGTNQDGDNAIINLYRVLGSIASGEKGIETPEQLDAATKRLVKNLMSGALTNGAKDAAGLASFLKGKRVYYKVKPKEITKTKGTGGSFWTSQVTFWSSRLEHEKTKGGDKKPLPPHVTADAGTTSKSLDDAVSKTTAGSGVDLLKSLKATK